MMQQETISFEQIRPPASGFLEIPEAGISMAEVAAVLLKRKKMITLSTFVLTVIMTVIVFIKPPSYKADATILPPQQQQSSLAALASGTLSGLAGSGMASQLGLKSAADLYIGILKSRTIADDIVERFHLKEVYGTKLMSVARRSLNSHVNFASGKDSLITITVKDYNPERAADLANAFVDELYKQNSRLATTDASQRRLFFEQQLNEEKEALANAEAALKATQQATGLLSPSGQAEILLRSGAQLRAEIVSREVQLQAMRAYATEDNPQLQILKREIASLQGQLSQIEARGGSGSKLELSADRMPEASLQYIRKLRDLKYHETLYELIAKQYEASRIDEAKQAPVIQVVDRAIVPDKDSQLPRALVVLLCASAGLILSSGSVLLLDRIRQSLVNLNEIQNSVPAQS
jgi:tyrosine-protein kinase Etk/Wzc